MQNSPLSKSTDNNESDGKKETISELAHRHLTDENHTTSDEELMNATVEFSSNVKAGDEDVAEAPDDEETLPGKSPLPNPYDVVSS